MASPAEVVEARRTSILRDERGSEQMEVVLTFGAVILPLVVAAYLLWAVLLAYFSLESFVVDLPLF